MARQPQARKQPDLAAPTDADRAGASEDRPPSSAGRRAGRNRRLRLSVQFALEALVLAGAGVFLTRRARRHLGSFVSLFLGIRWPWLVAAVAAEAASIVSLSFLQQRLVAFSARRVSLRDMVPVTLAANAVAMTVPVGVLVAEGYVYRQYRRLGASRAGSAWAELSAGALAAAALAAVAFAGSWFVSPGLRSVLAPTLGVVLIGSVAAAILFRRTVLLARLASRTLVLLERHSPKAAAERLRRIERNALEMAEFLPPVGLWGEGFAAASLNWLLDAVVLVFSILSVGGAVPWSGIVVVYAAGQLLAELPITPGGLGVVEGGLVAILTRFHMPAPTATASVLAYRGVSFWLLVLVGWTVAIRIKVHTWQD